MKVRQLVKKTINKSCRRWLPLVMLATIFSCGQPAQAWNSVAPQSPRVTNAPQRPKPDFSVLVKGGKLFSKNCAQCHGSLAQGHPHWNQADANGKYPPPPLNGTGHTWHHPTKVLKQIIKNGTGSLGGNMPAWKDKLSDADIEAILEWIKAQWPDDIYSTWVEREKSSKR